MEGVTGSSTAVSRPGTDALGVQGARINRSIRTFADACVVLSNLCYVSVFLMASSSLCSQTLKPSNVLPINRPHIHHTPHNLQPNTQQQSPLGYRQRAPPRIRRPPATDHIPRPEYAFSRQALDGGGRYGHGGFDQAYVGGGCGRWGCGGEARGEDCTWEECGEQAHGVEEAWDDLKPACCWAGGFSMWKCGSGGIGECMIFVFFFSSLVV